MDRSESIPPAKNSKLADRGSSQASIEPQDRVPEGFVNRRMLREMANATEHDLKSLEGDRLLRAAKKGAGGWRLYTLAQVERVREQVNERRQLREERSNGGPSKHLPAFRDHAVPYSLAEYNAVVDALAKGTPKERVPIETNVHPAIVKSIFKDQIELTGGIFVGKPIVDAINQLALEGVGTIRTAEELLEALKATNEEIIDGRKCLACNKAQRTHCVECATEDLKKELRRAAKAARAAQSQNIPPIAIQPLTPQTTR